MILFAMDDDQSSQAAFLTAQLHRLLKDAKSPTERHQIDVCLRVLPMEPSRPHPYTHSHQPSPIHFHSSNSSDDAHGHMFSMQYRTRDSPHRAAEEAVDASSTSFEQLGNARTTDSSSLTSEEQLGNSRKTVS